MVENVRLLPVRGSTLPLPVEALGSLALVSLACYIGILAAGAAPWVALLAALAFSMAVASMSSRAVGAVTFLFLALSPEGLAILFVGNLSNLFADALMFFGCSFLLIGRPVLASLTLLGGFLSHFGTLLLGFPLSLLLALIAGQRPSPVRRRVAPILAALVVSFLLYYRRFMNVVVEAWDRIAHLQDAVGSGPMTAPAAEKLMRMTGGESGWITAVALSALVAGLVTWPKDRPALFKVLGAWILVVGGFALLGLFTPVQVRSTLAARPVVAALCASGVVALWSRGEKARGLACLIIALTAAACWTIAISFLPAKPI